MITHIIYSEDNYLVEAVSATVNADDILDYDEVLRSDPEYRPEMSRIYDFRELQSFRLSTTEILKSVKRLQEWNLKRSIRIAFVVRSVMTRGTIKLVTSHYSGYAIKPFPSMEAARSWVTAGHEGTIADAATEQPRRFKRISLKGIIGIDDVMRKQLEWFESPQYDPTTSILWDLRQATTNQSVQDVTERAPYMIGNAQASNRTGRVAVLLDNYLLEMMVRQIAKTSGWRSEDNRIFRKEAEAIDWVSYHPDTLSGAETV